MSALAIATGAAVFVLGLFAKSLIPSYMSEKGKNLATKEDIAGLTRRVEEVRAEFERERQGRAENHDLRMLAAERRLDALQAAYLHWSRIWQHCFDEKLPQVLVEYREWWNSACLYLPAEVRVALDRAQMLARNQPDLVTAAQRTPDLRDKAIENWEAIISVGVAIERAAQLPSLASPTERPEEMKAIGGLDPRVRMT